MQFCHVQQWPQSWGDYSICPPQPCLQSGTLTCWHLQPALCWAMQAAKARTALRSKESWETLPLPLKREAEEAQLPRGLSAATGWLEYLFSFRKSLDSGSQWAWWILLPRNGAGTTPGNAGKICKACSHKSLQLSSCFPHFLLSPTLHILCRSREKRKRNRLFPSSRSKPRVVVWEIRIFFFTHSSWFLKFSSKNYVSL